MSAATYFVRLESGVVVRMTRAEYEAFWKGVARDVIVAMEDPEWQVQDGC